MIDTTEIVCHGNSSAVIKGQTVYICIFARISDSVIFLGIVLLLSLEICPQLYLVLKQSVITPWKPLNRISFTCYFVVKGEILCTSEISTGNLVHVSNVFFP